MPNFLLRRSSSSVSRTYRSLPLSLSSSSRSYHHMHSSRRIWGSCWYIPGSTFRRLSYRLMMAFVSHRKQEFSWSPQCISSLFCWTRTGRPSPSCFRSQAGLPYWLSCRRTGKVRQTSLASMAFLWKSSFWCWGRPWFSALWSIPRTWDAFSYP